MLRQVAGREGKSVFGVISKGNLEVGLRLSLRVKLAFWATNVPYYILSANILSANVLVSDLVTSKETFKLVQSNQRM